MSLLIKDDKDIIAIYNKYVDTVYRVAFMYLKNKSDAEDVLQNTFIKLMQNKDKIKSLEHAKAWLILTATNMCKNHLAYWWRKNSDIDNINEGYLAANDSNSEVLNAVLRLPNKYKTVIYLYYYEGYNSVEIASMLKKKEATVRYLLFEGRNKLKDLIVVGAGV